MKWNS